MRAMVLRDWWNLEVQQLPDPAPGPGEVLVEIAATGICGSDLHGYTGENGRRRPGQVMGHETAGHVRAVGPGVTGLAPGREVTVNPVLACGHCDRCAAGQEQSCPTKSVIGVTPSIVSAFAELMLAPAANVVPLPSGVPVELGALVEPLAVGYHALRRGACGAGDRVLVLGGGPIGQACVLAAQRLGADGVVVTEPMEHRRALVEDLGATVADPAAADGAGLAAAVADALGGPPTIAVDAVGLSVTLATALAATPPGSTVVLVGMGSPDLALAAYDVSVAERTVVGSFCYTAQEFRETAAWIGATTAPLDRLVERRVGLDGGPDAFAALARGEDQSSKVLVCPKGAA
ncbi:zinc-dependent alcohol dehydrogenase [Jiangella endophytica]|uniref:zinc-dependent alcohol dehydrogenase n=1 Tax=Jiangella endophytica TaxID=1623398 RepID=UPI000E351E57|nr:alcohol dehydrogenase catalytic domain-containing protein [Jiangella endophytica]